MPRARPRLELAVLAATTPWRLMVATFRGVGRAFAWLPFMPLAWRLRGVIALTYLVPAAGRRIERHTEAEADQLVLSLDLGLVLAGLLRRYGYPMTLERMQRLETAVEQPQRPQFHLAHD